MVCFSEGDDAGAGADGPEAGAEAGAEATSLTSCGIRLSLSLVQFGSCGHAEEQV